MCKSITEAIGEIDIAPKAILALEYIHQTEMSAKVAQSLVESFSKMRIADTPMNLVFGSKRPHF